MWKYALTAFAGAAIGTVAGVFLDRLMRTLKENRILKCTELLEKEFGEPMYVNKFSFDEVNEWILQRKEKITNGYKAVVLKVNKESFAKISSDLVIEEDLNKYLLLAIYKDGVFEESLLVKYETLDEKLLEMLSDDIMVVE